MAKVRVGEIAKELSLKASEALAKLKELGVEVKSNLSAIDDEAVTRLRDAIGGGGTQVAPPDKKEEAGRPASSVRTRSRAGAAGKSPLATASTKTTGSAAKTPAARKAATTGARTTSSRPASLRSTATEAGAAAQDPGAAVRTTPTPAAARRTPGAARTKTTTVPAAATRGPGVLRQPVTQQRPSTPPRSGGAAARGLPQSGARPLSPRSMPVAGRQPVTGARPAGTAARRPVDTSSGSTRQTSGTAAPQQAGLAAPAGSHAPRPTPGAHPSPPPTRLRPGPGQAARTGPPRGRGARPGGPRIAPPPPRPTPAPEPVVPDVLQEISISEGVTVKELSEKMSRKAKDIITRLLTKGVMATINQPLDTERAVALCREFGFDAKVVSFEEEVAQEHAEEVKPANLKSRDPVVTVMGHVDHGKTSLLDSIRETNVVAREAGGITQHIGAYHIQYRNRGITFIDTPGHEAFTMMRARGARVTDIVVLVVAADDGVMPQTVEAIAHARAAGVPMIVAINKIDKPGANIDRAKKQLADHDLLVEDWGGQVVSVPISAKQKTGIDDMLEMILLVADMADLKADPTSHAAGIVLESKLDKARGPVATVLVQRGTLRVGDPFIAGAVHGKVRAMFDDKAHRIREAAPSIPAEVLGLEGVPRAGDPFQVLDEEWRVRQIGAFRQQKLRQEMMASKGKRLTLDHLYDQIKEGMVRELPLIVKADVNGSVEALNKTLEGLPSDKVKIRVIHSGSGAITETDVLLASASNAIIIGYNVRPERGAQDLAEKEKVDIRLHSVIYQITKEIEGAMVGMLEPESKEIYLGRAEVRQTFKVPKIGLIAGCMVSDGLINRSADVRLLRDNVVTFTGKIASLRRFKNDASEVKSGYECGIGLANFNDVKVGDVIEAFRVEKVAAKSL